MWALCFHLLVEVLNSMRMLEFHVSDTTNSISPFFLNSIQSWCEKNFSLHEINQILQKMDENIVVEDLMIRSWGQLGHTNCNTSCHETSILRTEVVFVLCVISVVGKR